MADQVIFAPMRALDASNNPAVPTLSGTPRAYFYESGTASLTDIRDANGVLLANPLDADANGVFPQVFADGEVRVIVVDAAGVVLPGYPMDPAPKSFSSGGAASTISFPAQDNLPADDVEAALIFLADQIEATNAGLGDLASEDVADRTQTQTIWNAGTNTTESLISPAKLDARILAKRPVYESAEQTITAGSLITLTHGLGRVPRHVTGRLKCTSAEAGYSVGDQVLASLVQNTTISENRTNSVTLTATQIEIRFSSTASAFLGANKGTGVAQLFTNANWKLIIEAMA